MPPDQRKPNDFPTGIDLRHLQYFVAVAEELHFGRAAARLHIAQPGLSKAIRRLEHAVGAELLERNSRHVALTTGGELFLVKAREALTAAEEAVALARGAHAGDAGRLGLGYSPAARYTVYRQLRDAFGQACPDVEINAREVLSSELLDDLRARRVDVAVALLAPRVDGLVYRLVKMAPLVAVVSRSHPLAERESIAVAELAGERLLLVKSEPLRRYNEALIRLCQDAGFEPETGTLENRFDFDFSRIRSGEGVTIVPADYLQGEENRLGAAVVALDPTPRLPMELVWREGDLSPCGQRFVDTAQAVSRAEGWVATGEQAAA
jgi:DNA-binding transcriptional LysR family regulator